MKPLEEGEDDLKSLDIKSLVEDYPGGVESPWRALKEYYCKERPCVLWCFDSLQTAVELGFIKEVGVLKYRLTVKGYKMAERLWGSKEEACKEEDQKEKRSLWDLFWGHDEDG